MVAGKPIVFRCELDGVRIAELDGGTLWVRARHHGAYHETGFDVGDLAKLAAGRLGLEDLEPVSRVSPRLKAPVKELECETEGRR